MKIPFVDLNKQYITLKTEVDFAINSVIEKQAFIGGEFNQIFEESFANKNKSKFCIGVGNGTDAIFIALRSLGIGKGDYVITAANSFIASSEAITLAGAQPLFVDCNEHDFLINIDQIENILLNHIDKEKIKAIIPVHLYGQLVDMNKLMTLAKKYSLHVIEDCAQAHFSTDNKKYAGTFGTAGTFSFYPGKNLGAYGDAGAVITDDELLAKRIRMYANHGRIAKYDHEIEGTNSRLDGLQAAVLSVKLKYIDSWNKARYNAAKKYNEYLTGEDNIILPNIPLEGSHVFHLYTIRTKVRTELQKYLANKGISTGVHYPIALPNLKAYQYLNHAPSDFPNASLLQNEILSLPIFPEITEEQLAYVSDSIRDFYRNYQ
ncbi:MAG: DegT/DnrJ/EryC1/StrS family aminotransferase [Leptospira sp.]|nr:DegT/DnrJ/EryC1/StrS family aminotransferase [Leptospira sp.]